MNSYRTLSQAELSGKKVLLRAGFDVPMEEGRITDESRIIAVVPTMRYILDHGGALIIMAHQDRPKGKVVESMSQKPLVPVLERLLGTPVLFAPSCTGADTKQMVDALTPGQVILLENLRFDAREEANDENFSKELAELAEVYVNDAFANCHRSHASMTGVPALLPSYMGLGLEQEVDHLSKVLENPVHPLTLIVSGAKIETKLPVISAFLDRGDHILPGGAIANTLILSAGHSVGTSLAEAGFAVQGKQMLDASSKAVIHLPTDAIVAASPDTASTAHTELVTAIPADQAMFDLGPATAEAYATLIDASETIVWNGPLGMYEVQEFAKSSIQIADALHTAATRGATVIVGGGDTIDFHTKYKLDMSAYTFVSTGGGAMLEYLSGATLPALEALRVT